MGGRSSKSGMTNTPYVRNTSQQLPPNQPPQQNPTMQPSDDLQTQAQASATLAQLAAMDDDQLGALAQASLTVDMPNFLNDKPDITQKFVYQVGLNGAPLVLDQTQFDAFMKQNGIRQSQIMSRSVNGNGPYTATQIANTFKYSELNYIGGKYGGQVSGAGTYFDQNGGGNTGYGSGATITAVLNPATARVITSSQLAQRARSFAQSHPKFAAAVGQPHQSFYGGNYSTYALAMGYNVINNGGSYYNVIDRSAVAVLA